MLFLIRRWLAYSQRREVKVINALGIALVLNLVFGGLFFLAERGAQVGLTLQDSIWWAMVTMTTVGYGDFYAQTFTGRFLVSYPCFLLGIGMIGYLLGTVADGMMERMSNRRKGLMSSKHEDHTIICNCPSVEKVVRLVDEIRMRQSGTPMVLISDEIEATPPELVQRQVDFVKGAPVSEEVLRRANVASASAVLILARKPGDPVSDAESFATGAVVEQIEDDTGRSIKTVVELVSRKNQKLLARARTDSAVASEGIGDLILVQELLNTGANQIFEQLVTNRHGCEFYTVETSLRGVALIDVQIEVLRHDSNIQLLGILRGDDPMLNPSKSERIEAGDRLIVLAEEPNAFAKIELEIKAALPAATPA